MASGVAARDDMVQGRSEMLGNVEILNGTSILCSKKLNYLAK
jgi:hypothetical protein